MSSSQGTQSRLQKAHDILFFEVTQQGNFNPEAISLSRVIGGEIEGLRTLSDLTYVVYRKKLEEPVAHPYFVFFNPANQRHFLHPLTDSVARLFWEVGNKIEFSQQMFSWDSGFIRWHDGTLIAFSSRELQVTPPVYGLNNQLLTFSLPSGFRVERPSATGELREISFGENESRRATMTSPHSVEVRNELGEQVLHLRNPQVVAVVRNQLLQLAWVADDELAIINLESGQTQTWRMPEVLRSEISLERIANGYLLTLKDGQQRTLMHLQDGGLVQHVARADHTAGIAVTEDSAFTFALGANFRVHLNRVRLP